MDTNIHNGSRGLDWLVRPIGLRAVPSVLHRDGGVGESRRDFR